MHEIAALQHHAEALPARTRAWLVFAAVWLGAVAGIGGVTFGVGEAPRAIVPPGVLFGVGAVLAAGMIGLPRRAFAPCALAAVCSLTAGWSMVRVVPGPSGAAYARLSVSTPGAPPRLVRVEGRVVAPAPMARVAEGSPERFLFDRPDPGFVLAVDRVVPDAGPPMPLHAVATVRGVGLPAAGTVGDRVRVTGMLFPADPPRNPGEVDARPFAAQQRRLGTIGVGGREAVVAAEPLGAWDEAHGAGLALAGRLRASARRTLGLDAEHDDPRRALLAAVVLGERDPGAGVVERAFAAAGVTHILAISGFHVSLLCGLVLAAVRVSGDRPAAERAACVLVLVLMAVLVPMRTPIVRAIVLTAAVFLPGTFARRYDRMTVLAWVGSGLVLWRPVDAATLGYQLSVGVTALLLWLSSSRHPWATRRAEPWDGAASGNALRRAGGALRRSAAVYTMCWAVAAPLIAVHAGPVTPAAPLVGVVATPVVAAAMGVAYVAIAVGAVAPGAGAFLADLALPLASVELWLVGLGAKAPAFVLPRGSVSVGWAVVAVVAVVAVIRGVGRQRRVALAALAAVVLWTALGVAMASRQSRAVVLRVDMLDVGDGSCVLVRSGGRAMLWDCGSLRPGLGARVLPRALRALGVSRLDEVVITHANLDHYGALADLLDHAGVARVRVSAPALAAMRARTEGPEARFLAALERRGVAPEPLARDGGFDLGAARVGVLWPPAALPAGVTAANDASVVARVSVVTRGGERAVLLCGDVQRPAMAHLLAEAGLDADILELPHHGSHHALAEAFVAAVSPRVVMQSTGPSRLASRGWDEERAALSAGGGAWLITARDGSVTAEVRSDGEVRAATTIPPADHPP